MNAWSWYWLTLGGAVLFGEMCAIADDRPYDKLSQNVWRLQDVLPGQAVIWRALVAILLIILAYHWSFGSRH